MLPFPHRLRAIPIPDHLIKWNCRILCRFCTNPTRKRMPSLTRRVSGTPAYGIAFPHSRHLTVTDQARRSRRELAPRRSCLPFGFFQPLYTTPGGEHDTAFSGNGMTQGLHGLLVVDKPGGITSRAALDRCQRWFPAGTALGHTGTLDPLATGVLVVCVGRATRLAEFVQRSDCCHSSSGPRRAMMPTAPSWRSRHGRPIGQRRAAPQPSSAPSTKCWLSPRVWRASRLPGAPGLATPRSIDRPARLRLSAWAHALRQGTYVRSSPCWGAGRSGGYVTRFAMMGGAVPRADAVTLTPTR